MQAAAGKTKTRTVSAIAKRQHAALSAAIEAAQKSRNAVARAAEIAPSTLHNFFGDASKTLTLETWSRLCVALPALQKDPADNTAHSPGRRPKVRPSVTDGPVLLRAEAVAGLYQRGFDLPKDRQRRISLPIGEGMEALGAFGVLVGTPGAELLYPAGSILVCLPVANYRGQLASRLHVILQKITAAGTEVTVRELQIEASEAWLWMRSTHPRYQVPLPMPFSPAKPLKAWLADEIRYTVVAVVIASYSPRA